MPVQPPTLQTQAQTFLPKGFFFPLQIDPANGRMRMTAAGVVPTQQEYVAQQQQDILMVLTTPTGLRVMTPTYGSDLNKVPFRPNDTSPGGAGPIAQFYIQNAVRTWVPTVTIESVSLQASQELYDHGAVLIVSSFRVPAFSGINSVVINSGVLNVQ